MPEELVRYIVYNLASDVDNLDIRSEQKGRDTYIEIRCAQEDGGRIIGRGGRVISSIRTLARAASEGSGRIEVQLVD
jgi:predicted RNA-binding protein YlqC (UPF0109 family)